MASLDRLYEANLDYFHELEDYILAGEKKLEDLEASVIPALAKEAELTNDMIKAQQLRDLRTARDDLERRVHDLRLTRQVTMQSLPSIRLVQENDKALVGKRDLAKSHASQDFNNEFRWIVSNNLGKNFFPLLRKICHEHIVLCGAINKKNGGQFE